MELEAPSAHIVEAISELDPCNRVSTSENCPSSKVIMRKVVLERAAREPFGFSLGKKVVLRPAVYGVAIARPVDVDQLVPPSNGWLIPPLKGDVVVAVNGVSQLNKTYDEVLAAVNTAGDSFRLTLTTPKLPVTRSMSEWSMTSSDIVKIEDLQALQTRSIDFVAPEGQCIELALMKKNVKIRSELKGFEIVAVAEDSVCARTTHGPEPGDVVVEINGTCLINAPRDKVILALDEAFDSFSITLAKGEPLSSLSSPRTLSEHSNIRKLISTKLDQFTTASSISVSRLKNNVANLAAVRIIPSTQTPESSERGTSIEDERETTVEPVQRRLFPANSVSPTEREQTSKELLTHSVTITREDGETLGLAVGGTVPIRDGLVGVQIQGIKPGAAADKTESEYLKAGAVIAGINGVTMLNVDHDEVCMALLSGGPKIDVDLIAPREIQSDFKIKLGKAMASAKELAAIASARAAEVKCEAQAYLVGKFKLASEAHVPIPLTTVPTRNITIERIAGERLGFGVKEGGLLVSGITAATVATVAPGMAAELAGVTVGDRIVKINGIMLLNQEIKAVNDALIRAGLIVEIEMYNESANALAPAPWPEAVVSVPTSSEHLDLTPLVEGSGLDAEASNVVSLQAPLGEATATESDTQGEEEGMPF